jgi:hypothetical protein
MSAQHRANAQPANAAGSAANLDEALGRKPIPKPKGDPRRDKWIRWAAAIDKDLSALAINRMVWRTLTAIWRERSPRLPSSIIFDYFAATYAQTQASGIRRQVDKSHDVTSLWKLLSEIAANPQRLSREWFVGRYEWGQQWHGELEFASLDPQGLGYVNPESAAQDIQQMLKIAMRIRTGVNKHVAHLADRPANSVPTFAELDTALDLLAAIYVRWNCILTAVDITSLEPTPQYDWLAPLRVPWLLDSD